MKKTKLEQHLDSHPCAVADPKPAQAYAHAMGQADHAADALIAEEETRAAYERLLDRKTQYGSASGFAPLWVPDKLFGFQKELEPEEAL